jgi:protein farnesyltransferase subunit beta
VNGGLRDKPSKPKYFYHSCYVLSGLSVAQHALEPWPPSISTQTAKNEEKEGKFNRLFGDVDVIPIRSSSDVGARHHGRR